MQILKATVLLFTLGLGSLSANDNVEKVRYTFSLSQANRGNVVRLKNQKGIVRYIFEAWLDGWEIESPDDQLGGSLCIRVNNAGGRYIPGCLLCREGSYRNYTPEGCFGIFTEDMLLKAFSQSQNGVPISYSGHGMSITLLIKKLTLTNEPLSKSGDHKVKELLFDLEIQPNPSIPLSKQFMRLH